MDKPPITAAHTAPAKPITRDDMRSYAHVSISHIRNGTEVAEDPFQRYSHISDAIRTLSLLRAILEAECATMRARTDKGNQAR